MTLSVEHLDRRCDTLEQALLAIELKWTPKSGQT